MSNTAENDAHVSPQACSRCNPLACACWCHGTGCGPLCEWDEDMALAFHHPEHKARLAAARAARRADSRARFRASLARVLSPGATRPHNTDRDA